MGDIAKQYTSALKHFKRLVVDKNDDIKKCLLIFPDDTLNKTYSKKVFNIECLASAITGSFNKATMATFTNEDIGITLLYDDIKDVLDTKGTVACPYRDFRMNNVKVKYNKVQYVVRDESINGFDASVTLLCEAVM